MREIMRIAPLRHEPGLIAYECPACEKLTSEIWAGGSDDDGEEDDMHRLGVATSSSSGGQRCEHPFAQSEHTIGIDGMPLSPEQEAICERLEKGESIPDAAALIRHQAHEIDDLWHRLSRAYALLRQESPAEMMHGEMEQLRIMLNERRKHAAYGSV
jgi:hypothetical protein